MAIRIDDNSLEARLIALGERQMVRANKTRMALSILERALSLCDASGDPEAWRAAANSSHLGSVDSSQPAVDSVQTDQSPATQGEDMTSEASAAAKVPPSGPEPRSDDSPAEARRQAS